MQTVKSIMAYDYTGMFAVVWKDIFLYCILLKPLIFTEVVSIYYMFV